MSFVVHPHSLTLLSLPLLVAQYSIRHDEFSGEQHLDPIHSVGGRVVFYIHWSMDRLWPVVGKMSLFVL